MYQVTARHSNGLPGVSNKDIYNWEEINIYSGNYGKDNAESMEFSVEQEFFDDLFIELAARKEEFHRYSLNAQSGTNSGLYVDINETQLDGTPNPFFMKPYLETWIPTPWDNIETSETVRATVAYTLDFTQKDNWMKWLGRHNIMGLGQKKQGIADGYRWREAVISSHDWTGNISDFKSSGANAKQAFNRVFYLGDHINVTHAPGEMMMYAPGQVYADYPYTVGETWNHTLRGFVVAPDADGNIRDGDTSWPVAGGRLMGDWVDEQVTGGLILHDAYRDEEKITSYSGVIQSYFWKDRIVTTFGWRHDKRLARWMVGPDLNEFGLRDHVVSGLNTPEVEWDEVSGTTKTTGIVFKPLEWLNLHYNKSDTFRPASVAQNLFLETLPNPSGSGEDYGIMLSFMDEKLVARVNWYEATEADSRSGISLYTWRARRVENEGSWGIVDMVEREIEVREGLEDGALDAFTPGDPTTAPYLSEIAQKSGLSEAFLQQDRGFDDTGDITSKGMEISIDYNPIPNWNVKFTAARQETINSDVAGSTQRWLWGDGTIFDPAPGSRLDVWQNAEFADANGNMVNWWTTHWEGMPSWGYTPQEWYEGVVQAGLLLAMATDGTPRPQVREWRWAVLTNYRFDEGPLNGFGVGGSVRWEDQASIGNELLANPDGSGYLNLYDPNKSIFDDANFYVDVWCSYRTKIWNDKVGLKIQFNVRDLFEDGGLQVIQANPDGSPRAFRIKDPRTYYLTTTLSF